MNVEGDVPHGYPSQCEDFSLKVAGCPRTIHEVTEPPWATFHRQGCRSAGHLLGKSRLKIANRNAAPFWTHPFCMASFHNSQLGSRKKLKLAKDDQKDSKEHHHDGHDGMVWVCSICGILWWKNSRILGGILWKNPLRLRPWTCTTLPSSGLRCTVGTRSTS